MRSLIVFLMFLSSSPSSFGQSARLVCTNRSFDFGEITSTQQVRQAFTLCNSGSVALIIGHIQACCGMSVNLTSTNIPAGKSATLELTFKPSSVSGPVRKTIYVHTNDPEEKIVAFRLSGAVVQKPKQPVALPKPPN